MQEINRLYGRETTTKPTTKAAKPSRSTSAHAAAEGGVSIKKKKKVAPRPDDEEAESVDFESGFDHGFESMATFNGRDVGREGESAASSSVGAAAAENNAKKPTANFDFNFSAPAQGQ